MMELGEFMRITGVTNKQLAEKLDVGSNMVGKYAAGTGLPSTRTAYLIELATGGLVTLSDLMKTYERATGTKFKMKPVGNIERARQFAEFLKEQEAGNSTSEE